MLPNISSLSYFKTSLVAEKRRCHAVELFVFGPRGVCMFSDLFQYIGGGHI